MAVSRTSDIALQVNQASHRVEDEFIACSELYLRIKSAEGREGRLRICIHGHILKTEKTSFRSKYSQLLRLLSGCLTSLELSACHYAGRARARILRRGIANKFDIQRGDEAPLQ